ncbi:MAG: hypothetical protein ABW019_14280 [Chitinophagaceae bacterium]
MNLAVHRLVKSVTGKESLSECSTSELEQLAAQHPFFGPAQLLLACKLRGENDAAYEAQARKAMVHFPDPLWYDYITTPDPYEAVLTQPAITEEPADQPVIVENVAAVPVPAEETDLLPEQETAATAEENIVPADQPGSTATLSAKPGTMEETGLPAFGEAIIPAEEIEADDANQPDEEEPALPPLPRFDLKPVEPAENALVFEPYHTVDYFASQGIRTPLAEKSGDRFSQQLKSFTEWLKAMKRLPEPTAAAQPTAGEEQVDQMAERSVTGREVITETMAEVWEKQGNHAKAIDTYSKLSLLNPSKSAYFAAKIEHLKHQ